MFVCDECGREYQSHETLKRHRRNHIDSIKYTCEVCGVSFKRKDLLKKHGRTHTEPRQRSLRACVQCSNLKLACDSRTPCSRCTASAVECIYRSDKDPTSPGSGSITPITNPRGRPSLPHSWSASSSRSATWTRDTFSPSSEASSRPSILESSVFGLDQVIQTLVEEAPAVPQAHRAEFWSRAADSVATTFQIQSHLLSGRHVFDYFLGLYFHHFHNMWPLIWKLGTSKDDLAPHVYLTMTAIGAAYDTDLSAVRYHIEMLRTLGLKFLESCHEQPETPEAALSLSQSILLSQVSVFHFGRQDMFPICHDLSLSWISTCRNFTLPDENLQHIPSMEEFVSMEAQRRIINAFLQVEIAAKVISGHQPQLRMEELSLYPPMPDSIWSSADVDDMLAIRSVKHRNLTTLSSLVLTALDPQTQLPDLHLSELEFLLGGLLYLSSPRAPWTSAEATRALKKCQMLLANIDRRELHTIPEKTSLINSDYSLGVGVFWLKSNVVSLSRLARACYNGEELDLSAAAGMRAWANTEEARECLHIACCHGSRTRSELLANPVAGRADFTIIAHVALYYSAIVVWVFLNCRTDGWTASLNYQADSHIAMTELPQIPEMVSRRPQNCQAILREFANLLKQIRTVEHDHQLGFAIYHDVINTLSTTDFPILE